MREIPMEFCRYCSTGIVWRALRGGRKMAFNMDEDGHAAGRHTCPKQQAAEANKARLNANQLHLFVREIK